MTWEEIDKSTEMHSDHSFVCWASIHQQEINRLSTENKQLSEDIHLAKAEIDELIHDKKILELKLDADTLTGKLRRAEDRLKSAQDVAEARKSEIVDLKKENNNLILKINQLKTEISVRKAYDRLISVERDKHGLVEWDIMRARIPAADGYICHMQNKTVEMCYEFCSEGDLNGVIGIVPVWWRGE